MAEFVEQSIEEMVSELEQMERVGLFQNSEIRQILKKRKVFEYKLRRRTKVKQDYINYIQYETNLLALVKRRRERTGYNYKKIEIDMAIVQRIHRLYKLALYRFPDDIKLWMTRIAFSESRNEKSLVSRLYTNMLQVHSRKPDLWLAAAKWEFESNINPENARSLLQRGLRFIPESKMLWHEYFRYELLFAEKMRKRRSILEKKKKEHVEEEEVEDAVLTGQLAQVAFTQALQSIPGDVEFVTDFIPICQLFDFTQDIEEAIFQELKKSFSDKPATWDALARRSLGRPKDGPEDPELLFHQVYEEAVNTLGTDEIWTLYLEACLEIQDKSKGKKQLQAQHLQRTLLVFEEAKEAGHLTADLWEKWVDLLCDSGHVDEAVAVSESATSAIPSAANLWLKRLSLLTLTDADIDKMQTTLKEAQKNIPEKAQWPLIQMVLDKTMGTQDQEITVQLLESSMIGCSEIALPAKEMYLEFEYLKHGITQARKIYDRVSQYQPVSVQFYRSYISMEMAQSPVKMKLVCRAYEDALREHGKSETDLWLDYIKLEASHPQGKPENAGKIHFRAVKSLVGSANHDFVRRYTLEQTGH